MDYLKVKKLHSIGDSGGSDLCVYDDGGTLKFSMASPTRPIPECKPTAEMLKKALEYVENYADDCDKYLNDFEDGKDRAYRNVAAHLEMLIKEAR